MKKRTYTDEQRQRNREYQRQWERDNRERRAAKDKRYYEANKEMRVAKANAWKAANPDRVKACRLKYTELNKERLTQMRLEWRKLNPEKDKETQKKFFASDKGKVCKVRHTQNRRARKNAYDGKLSKGIVSKLMFLQKRKCVSCRCNLAVSGHHLDHIIALANGGLNVDTNVQLLCPACNIAKRVKHPIDFMQSKGYLL